VCFGDQVGNPQVVDEPVHSLLRTVETESRPKWNSVVERAGQRSRCVIRPGSDVDHQGEGGVPWSPA